MAYLDPELLLQQAGLLKPRPAAPVGGPLAALAATAPLSRGPSVDGVTPEQAYNASIQAKLNAASEAARVRNTEEPGGIVDRLGAAAAKIYEPLASVATGPLGLVTSQFPQHEAAAAGPVAQSAGAELTNAREYLSQAGGGQSPAVGTRAAPGGGGGGGGAPQPIERDLLTPTQRAEYERGIAMQRDAATEGAGRVNAALAQQEEAAHAYERDLQAQEAGRARAEQTRADELRFRQQDYDDAVQQAAKFKIDPMRSSKGGAWFGDVIGILLTGLAGTPEMALEQIDKRIARDVDAQRAEYQALDGKAKGAQNAYAMLMQRFGDARAAEKGTRDALALQYGSAMQRAAIGMKNADADNAAQKMMADIQSKYAADTLQFLKATPVGGGAVSREGLLYDTSAEKLVRMPDGTLAEVDSPAAAKQIKDRQAFEANVSSLQGQALALYQKHGREVFVPGTQAHEQMEIFKERALPIVSKADEQGVIRDTERGPLLTGLGLKSSWTDVLRGADHRIALLKQAQSLTGEGSRELLNKHGTGVRVLDQQVVSKDGRKVHTQYQYAGRGGAEQPKPGMPGSTKPAGGR